ncbi:hypothetical protein GGR54DRAFT_502240 [Hypoxylon sp. NC1633]|nr:hypothetical protein GGR54DRAFT_502240 [Hypoxylon sp. NC1633]
MNDTLSPFGPGPSYASPFIRSCTSCRHRKVKCDRQQPCANCAKAKSDCLYPPGRGRAPKRPRRAPDCQLADRLTRLESIIRRLKRHSRKAASKSDSGVCSEAGPLSSDVLAQDHHEPLDRPGLSTTSIDQHMGRLMIDDTKSCYVSNALWVSLGNEIEELRDMLHDPATEDGEDYEDEDDDDDASTGVPSSHSGALLMSNAAILGFRALAQSLRSFHPPLPVSVALFKVFNENVVPLVRIFHMPTTVRIYWDAVASLESLDKNTEALLFAVYYSAVISLQPEQCVKLLGVTHEAAVGNYRFAVEQAMARANFLNTQSIVLLQAAVIYLSALRNEDDSRKTWSLTSLIYHVAQAMGLHRDGAVFGLKPLETEVRRRVWHHICLLDIPAEHHGYEPIARQSAFDTRTPLNINDSDLTAEMTEAPPEREGVTEMTFCLIRCEAMRVGWKVTYVPPGVCGLGEPATGPSLADKEAMIEALEKRLEEKYLRHCDTSVPFLLLVTTVTRLVTARFWLMAHYPLYQKGDCATNLHADMRDRLFLTSTKILELSSLLLANSNTARWTWHSKTHIQWHAVAFVLSEICSRPPSADCDRAWGYVKTVYDVWKLKSDESKGILWRPIKRLMVKARYVREMQRTGPYGHVGQQISANTSTSGSHDRGAVVPSSLSAAGSEKAYTSPLGPDPVVNSLQDVFGIESLDDFAHSFPDVLSGDLFTMLPVLSGSDGIPLNATSNGWEEDSQGFSGMFLGSV